MFETCQHAQSAGLLPPGRRNFSLKSVRIPAKKLLASGPKSLAAGHIANFQTSPSNFFTDFFLSLPQKTRYNNAC
ncbi:hypothetical protein B5E42_10710 [Flavonifractor sp. An10]|nr:hypothetical protein B5E42_10710 [Flavonifractor sp. An10]